MIPASRALRLSLRLSKLQLRTRPQTQPTLCARVAYSPGVRSRQCQPPHSFSSAFSTQAIRLYKAKRQNDPDDGAWKPYAMSFKSVGVRKNLKLIIFTLATAIAIMELLIWGESFWKWWKGEEGDKIE